MVDNGMTGSLNEPSEDAHTVSRAGGMLVILFVACAAGCRTRPAAQPSAGPGPVHPQTQAVSQEASVDPGARHAIAAAKDRVLSQGLSERLLPEPAQVVDKGDHWEVWFDYRPKIVEANGKQVVETQLPSSLRVDVQKTDFSARIVPGR